MNDELWNTESRRAQVLQKSTIRVLRPDAGAADKPPRVRRIDPGKTVLPPFSARRSFFGSSPKMLAGPGSCDYAALCPWAQEMAAKRFIASGQNARCHTLESPSCVATSRLGLPRISF